MPTFPALDEEPAHRPWQPPVITAGVVVAIVVAVVAAVMVANDGDDADRAAGAAIPSADATSTQAAELLALDEDQRVVLARPNGQGELVAIPDAVRVRSGFASTAPNGRHVLTGNDQLLTIADGQVTGFRRLPPPEGFGPISASFRPWADEGRALLYVGRGRSADQPIVLVPLGGGSHVELGTGIDAAADPTTRGAVVMTTSDTRRRPLSFGATFWSTATVELRAGGNRVLITGDGFARALGLSTTRAYRLSASVSLDGRHIAVFGDDFRDDFSGRGGIVVLTRSGEVVAAARQPSIGDVVWSSDNRTLAITVFPGGPVATTEFNLMRLGGRARLRAVDIQSGSFFERPVWSPDGRTVAVSAGAGWYLVNGRSAGVQQISALAVPIAWLRAAG